jgi:hypothetical protein
MHPRKHASRIYTQKECDNITDRGVINIKVMVSTVMTEIWSISKTYRLTISPPNSSYHIQWSTSYLGHRIHVRWSRWQTGMRSKTRNSWYPLDGRFGRHQSQSGPGAEEKNPDCPGNRIAVVMPVIIHNHTEFRCSLLLLGSVKPFCPRERRQYRLFHDLNKLAYISDICSENSSILDLYFDPAGQAV